MDKDEYKTMCTDIICFWGPVFKCSHEPLNIVHAEVNAWLWCLHPFPWRPPCWEQMCPFQTFWPEGWKKCSTDGSPLQLKLSHCHARGSNRQQHLRLACAFHYSRSWYAPLRQSTAVMRLKTAEQSAQLLTALVLRVRRESHACVWNIVRSLASVAIIMRDCRMPLIFASAVFRCERDPLPTNPWGGLSITCQRDSHRWWESFQIPTFWSFYTHWAQWCLWCVAGGYAVTRLLCFHYVVELFVLDCPPNACKWNQVLTRFFSLWEGVCVDWG